MFKIKRLPGITSDDGINNTKTMHACKNRHHLWYLKEAYIIKLYI